MHFFFRSCLRSFPVVLISFALRLHADDLRLPALIADHMVLQTGKPVALWGWSPAGAQVKAEYLDAQGKVLASADATAPGQDRWMITLPKLAAGTIGTLRITSGATVKTFQDVAVGEVWLGGGQSNMSYDFGSDNIPPAQMEAAKQQAIASNGAIRFFHVDWASPENPTDDVPGHWQVINGDNFHGCSCVAWYFAHALREKIPGPVGMIVSAIGGTSVTQWMSKEPLHATSAGPGIEQNFLRMVDFFNARMDQWRDDDNTWQKAYATPELQTQNAASRPHKPGPPNPVSTLYNGMIHGLEPYTMRGIIWFQADGDMGIPYAYGELIKAMVKEWRDEFHDELPFYYVEMNNMREFPPKDPNQGNDALSILRQQQQAVLEMPQADVACSIDVGLLEPEPHFPNKEPVGQRLALLAFNNVYAMPCAAHSPAYDSMTVEGNKIRLKFKYAEGLRVRGGGEMIGFQIHGATGPWVWAQGKIDGQDIIVGSDQIPAPTEVKYAWSMNPLISVENGASLPLRPFSTTLLKP
jgi:sialate O-acetylesterase